MPAPGGTRVGCRACADRPDDDDVLLFLATLGSALSAIGETVDAVETRLEWIARSYGLRDARFSAFPTFVLLTLGQGKAATIEPTARLSGTPPSTRSPPSTSSLQGGARRGRADRRHRAARRDPTDGQPVR